jgi:hypothetical protein
LAVFGDGLLELAPFVAGFALDCIFFELFQLTWRRFFRFRFGEVSTLGVFAEETKHALTIKFLEVGKELFAADVFQLILSDLWFVRKPVHRLQLLLAFQIIKTLCLLLWVHLIEVVGLSESLSYFFKIFGLACEFQ